MHGKRQTAWNVIVSFFSQIIILLLGFIVPRIIISNYGSDTNGLISTINQIFVYMALLEAGISQAARNALYKPVRDNNHIQISYWISVARSYYRKITVVYLAVVIALSFVTPFLLKTEVVKSTVILYSVFEGLTNVVSFYFINTWACFLHVSGKTYIINAINVFTTITCYIVKILLSLNNVNIAAIQIGYFLVSLIKLLIYYIYMKKHYPWIEYSKVNKDSKLPDRNAYIVTEIAWTVFSSTDMIVLSAFVSTALSSVYSVYNMVFLAINNLLNAVYSSVNYRLGHAYAEDINTYSNVHSLFHSVFMSLITIMMCVAYLLCIPFISFYTNGVNDIDYIYNTLPIMFCLVQLLSWSRYIAGNLSGLAGYAKPTSYISIIEAAINIICSVILVNYYGIIGVLFATVIALPLKVLYLNYIAEIHIMRRSPVKTILTILINYSIFGLTIFINRYLHFNISSLISFVFWGFVLSFVFSLIIFSANILVNRDLINLIPTKRIRALFRKV